MVYGLTKGQASPTSQRGMETGVQVDGVILKEFNPLAFAIALDASFVARTFVGNQEHMKETIKKAIQHKGYALVDVFQPCVSMNKINTYSWFKEHTYILDEDYDPTNREEALKKAFETEKYPLGVIYKSKDKAIFTERLELYHENKKPLIERDRDLKKFARQFLKSST
jgi:2-oxoglutarate ferredoxin oxidoreductase subunit beta